MPVNARLIGALAELYLNPVAGGYRLRQPGPRSVAVMRMTEAIECGNRAVGKRCVRLAET